MLDISLSPKTIQNKNTPKKPVMETMLDEVFEIQKQNS